MQPQRPGQQPVGTHGAVKNQSVARRAGLVAALILVVAGLTTSLLFLINRSGDTNAADDADTFVVTQAALTQPVFEPRSAEGDASFFPIAVQVRTFEGETGIDVDEAAIESGLYGGTVENTCDPERLIGYLAENPEKAAAWALAQGIEVSQVPDYIRALDARVLAAPAEVINYGFDDATGAAVPTLTTLDAGTAVLVDADGNIRSRCYCGNPTNPRPPVFRESSCLVNPALVFTAAGSGAAISDAPQQVVLTGMLATSESATWLEVTWGNGAEQTAWTAETNLQPGLCPPASAPIVSPTATVAPAPGPTATPTPRAEPTPTVTSPTPTATVAPQPTATSAPATPPTATPVATPTSTPTAEPTCPDADSDGICNADDNCRDVANSEQLDRDNDGKGNACDDCTDQDQDLHCAETDDTCPNDYDPALVDTDLDGIGDVCDNCPTISNANQADANGDDVGDACEDQGNNDCLGGSYLGLDRATAEAKAVRNDCRYRIIRIDGETFPGTTDFVIDRMNWQIDNNIVTAITFG